MSFLLHMSNMHAVRALQSCCSHVRRSCTPLIASCVQHSPHTTLRARHISHTSHRHFSGAVALDTAHFNQQLQPPPSHTTTNTTKYNNITPGIQGKVGKNLHNQPDHPICIIKQRIIDYFTTHHTDTRWHIADTLSPRVSTQKCFDDLFIDSTHVSRQPSDTFYYDPDTVLRTHTSAHEREMLTSGHTAFLIAGDCYRRDEIDRTHYPVFHQMEGVRVFEGQTVQHAVSELKRTLEGLARHLFGQDVQLRWDDDVTFPWTEPSFELYVMYNGEWLEVLGSGILKQRSLQSAELKQHVAWAFGMGLDRLAMILFSIPDIRLFWSDDTRFTSQFKRGVYDSVFQPFSKYPYCYKDITFWLPAEQHKPHSHTDLADTQHVDAGVSMQADGDSNSDQDKSIARTGWHDNDFSAIVREIAGDLVEQIDCVDTFKHPKTRRWSRCYRITYRDQSRSLTNEEVDQLQLKVREEVVKQLGVEIR